uniref:(California timema) hypothetical protein n=1 Tax=Timema californicum TaxID=61474 RepID=A0A7R9J0P5_TIMCA|nr:unnamed protein product [Timema californicum]
MVQKYQNSKIESLCVQDRSMWCMTRNLMGIPVPMPPIVGRKGMANSNQEKADSLVKNIETQFVPTDDLSDLMHPTHVAQEIGVFSYKSLDEPEPTEVTEMSWALAALRLNRTSGCDGINSVVLRKLSLEVIKFLVELFNAFLLLSHFPQLWKHANVFCFHKPGKDLALATSY